MDVGVFTKTRTRFRMFILLPVVIPAAIMLVVGFVSSHASRSLTVRQSLLDYLPSLERNLVRSQMIIAEYQPLEVSGTVDSSETIRQFLNTSSSEAGFIINTMSVQDAELYRGDIRREDATLIVELSGEGSAAAVIRFASALQAFRGLIVVERAEIYAKSGKVQDQYAGSFVISFYDMETAVDTNS